MRNRQQILSLIVAVTATTVTGANLFADDTNTAPASAIDQRIDALDKEIQDLKRQREIRRRRSRPLIKRHKKPKALPS
jgi:ribosome-associated translation inhibitor RaiA